MKGKIFILMLCMVLLVGTATAFEFDNVKSYDVETKTVDIRNSILGIEFLQLGQVATVKLETPREITITSINQPIAEFNINNAKNYQNFLNKVETFEKVDGGIIFNTNYRYEYFNQGVGTHLEFVEVTKISNGTNYIVSEQQEVRGSWLDFNEKFDLPSGNKRIRMYFAEQIPSNQLIEVVPTFFGVRVEEWFTVELKQNFDDATPAGGGHAINIQSGTHRSAGQIFTPQTDQTIVIVEVVLIRAGGTPTGVLYGGITNATDVPTPDAFIALFNNVTASDVTATTAAGARADRLNFTFSNNNASLAAGVNYSIVIMGESLDPIVISWIVSSGSVYPFARAYTQATTGGAFSRDGVERSLLFRTWALGEPPPVVNNNIPTNLSTITNNNVVVFSGDASSGIGIANVSLFINGVLNQTNSSGFSGSQYNFTTTMPEGTQNWFFNAWDTGSPPQNNNGTGMRFTINTEPTLIVKSPLNTTFSTSTIFFNATNSTPIGTYIVNYNGTNVTLSNINTTLIVEDGFHHLLLYANNSVSGKFGLNDTIFFTVDTLAPSNLNITVPFGFVPYHVSGESLKVNWNVSDPNIDTCRVLLNNINTTVTCSLNTTQITNVNNVSATEIVFYANDTLGNSATTNRTFTYSAFQNALFFNSTSFETKQESFTINITTNSTTPANPEFIYNGTTFVGTVTSIAGNNFNISRTINVLTGSGNKTFNFNFTLGGKEIQGTDNQQAISGISFGLCNGTLTSQHLNFTFRNETLGQENVNGTFDSTWVYSLGELSGITKGFTFSNATENANYTFCGNPSTIPYNINVNLTYNNDISQQRSFSLTSSVSNVTATQVLYLLPTSLGLFSPFQTLTITGDTLTDVKAVITRILGGSIIDVSSGFTDGSGFISFFLDPDETYTATFSKAGVADNTFSFFPVSSPIRAVIMGQEASAIGNGTTIARGLIYTITPTNGTLANNTDVNFTLSASSNETITFMSLNITNSTNTELLFTSSVSEGLISGIFNTGNQTRLIGTYVIQTATETITVKRIWLVAIEFEGEYSIYRQLTLFTTYGFSDFIRIMMVLFFISAIMIFLTRNEVIDTSESKIIVATLFLWAFSIVGWLDTGLVTSTTSSGINRLAQFSNQFGMAIIATGFAAFFTFRRIFIRKL